MDILKKKNYKIQILKAKKEITEIQIVKADHGYSLCEHRNEEILL